MSNEKNTSTIDKEKGNSSFSPNTTSNNDSGNTKLITSTNTSNQTICGTRAIIPMCENRKFIKLDSVSLHKYFFQYYLIGTPMYPSLHFIIDSIVKAPPKEMSSTIY